MINFSRKVLEYKNSYVSLSEVIKETNDFFDKNYFPGASVKTKFNPPFVPGQIYSFEYRTPSTISENRKYINRNPVVICTDSFQSKEIGFIMKGIDLITVPPDIRVTILERIYDKFLSVIESGFKPIPVTDEILKNLLSDTGFSKSLFGFRVKYFGEIYRIDPKDWCRIPYLSKSFVEGLNLQGIYNLYKMK
jgi:hypothetical protein